MGESDGTAASAIFVAVAEALNFTKVTARLRVAQPALSRQITDLGDRRGLDETQPTRRHTHGGGKAFPG